MTGIRAAVKLYVCLCFPHSLIPAPNAIMETSQAFERLLALPLPLFPLCEAFHTGLQQVLRQQPFYARTEIEKVPFGSSPKPLNDFGHGFQHRW